MAQQQLLVRDFQLGTAHFANLPAVATSLAPIRRAIGPRLLGLVGYGVLRAYEVVLDYAHRRLTCYPVGRSGQRPFIRRDSVAFTLEKGLPVAAGFIGRVLLRRLRDTDTMGTNLDVTFTQHLHTATRPRVLGREVVISAVGQQAAQRARLPLLQLGGSTWHELPVVRTTLAR